jgi:epoxyqueuosine reductase
MESNFTIWEKIKEYSKTIEIDLIGASDVAPFNNYKEKYIEREKKGYLSGFESGDIEHKINPKLIMKDAKTIISIGVSYNCDKDLDNNDKFEYKKEFRAKLSKIAHGIDYHIVLKEKLENLMQFCKEFYPQLEYQIFVDTGMLPDREIAYRSGIGFFGKNNVIINPELGAAIFLGHALVNIDLLVNKTVYENMCGSCDICVKSCPTGALGKGFELNAKRCLSYLTQSKEDIDENLAVKMNEFLYGCDICTRKCPYTINAKKVFHKEFITEYDKKYIEIDSFLKLTNKEFKALYEKSACAWRGKKILNRNAEIIKKNVIKRNNGN